MKMRMRLGLIFLAYISLITPARAQSLEDDYLKVRRAYAAEYKKMEKANRPSSEIDRFEKEKFADLEKRLKRLLGVNQFAGYSPKPKLSLEVLSEDCCPNSHLLDGLKYIRLKKPTDDEIIVTTPYIAKSWMKESSENSKYQSEAPEVTEIFFSKFDFIEYVFGIDVRMLNMGRVPIKPPVGVQMTVAYVGNQTQDILPPVASSLYIIIVNDDRIYIASETLKKSIEPIPKCAKIYKQIEDLSTPEARSSQKTDKKIESIQEKENKLDKQFLKCFSENAAQQPAFADAVAQAQALADNIAASRR